MPQLVWMHIVDVVDAVVVVVVVAMVQALAPVKRTPVQALVRALIWKLFLQPFVTYHQPHIRMHPCLSKQTHTIDSWMVEKIVEIDKGEVDVCSESTADASASATVVIVFVVTTTAATATASSAVVVVVAQ